MLRLGNGSYLFMPGPRAKYQYGWGGDGCVVGNIIGWVFGFCVQCWGKKPVGLEKKKLHFLKLSVSKKEVVKTDKGSHLLGWETCGEELWGQTTFEAKSIGRIWNLLHPQEDKIITMNIFIFCDPDLRILAWTNSSAKPVVCIWVSEGVLYSQSTRTENKSLWLTISLCFKVLYSWKPRVALSVLFPFLCLLSFHKLRLLLTNQMGYFT